MRSRRPFTLSCRGFSAGTKIAIRRLFIFAFAIFTFTTAPIGLKLEHGSAAEPPPQKTTFKAKIPSKQLEDQTLNEAPLTHPITVRGKALNEEGQPISGARIFIASTSIRDLGKIAETTTDAAGNYEFRQVRLPYVLHDPEERWAVGRFQVFGQAAGYGFVWAPQQSFGPRLKLVAEPQRAIPETVMQDYTGEFREFVNLQFPRAASLIGKILDDEGQPIPGVKLALRYCNRMNLKDFRKGVLEKDDFSALDDGETVPAAMRLRQTDVSGNFEFTEFPPRCLLLLSVAHPDFATQTIHAATTNGPLPKFGRFAVHAGEVSLTFPAVKEIPLQIVYGDTRLPAQKVFVEADRNELPVSSWRYSNDQGRVPLRLPAGEYAFNLIPQTGTQYLPTTPAEKLVVKPGKLVKPFTLQLEPACTIEVSIVDDRTGAGVPGVDLWMSEPGQPTEDFTAARWEVVVHSWDSERRLCRHERPRTDRHGKLLATVKPGKYRIGPSFRNYPDGYDTEHPGHDLECPSGKTVPLTIRLKPAPIPK